jgi:hypothetical protein
MTDETALPVGTVDFNVHYGPDVVERSQTAAETLTMADKLGLRGYCLRSHTGSSTDLAHALDAISSGPRVVGGLTLNRSAGGINVAAVQVALETGARVISLPTWHSAASGPDPIRVVDAAGTVLEPVREIFELVAEADACLDLGMAPAAELLILVRQAAAQRIDRIVVSHPFHARQAYPLNLQAEAARAGAVIEHCFMQFAPGYSGAAQLSDLVPAVRAVGCDRVVLSSDSGLAGMNRLDSALPEFHRMLAPYFSAADLTRMFAETPAALLNLS